jgi:hypothetical protein
MIAPVPVVPVTWGSLALEDKKDDDQQRTNLEKRYGKSPENPPLDARWDQLPEFMRKSMVLQISQKPVESDTPEQKAEKIQKLLNDGNYDTAHELPATADDAEVVSSLDLETYTHRPVLDIDIPAALIPSSTPGHSHLYIDKPLTWDQYENLLWALVDCGIIESGYASASVARGYTSARLPWVKKPAVTS